LDANRNGFEAHDELERAYYEVLVSRSDLKTSFNAIKSPASMHAENCSAMTRCKLE
jgi:hypothetical protein